jgi:hypothetical protein
MSRAASLRFSASRSTGICAAPLYRLLEFFKLLILQGLPCFLIAVPCIKTRGCDPNLQALLYLDACATAAVISQRKFITSRLLPISARRRMRKDGICWTGFGND